MRGTLFYTVRVNRGDADRAVALIASEFEGHIDANWPTDDPRLTHVEFNAFYGPDPDDVTELGFRETIDSRLTAGDIWFETAGAAKAIGGSQSDSRFVIHPHGSTDPADGITIHALDEAAMRAQYAKLEELGFPPLAELEIDVTPPRDI